MNPDSGLPSNWVVRFSKSKSLPYYYNTATKVSQWEPPEDADEEKLKAYIDRNFPASAIHKIRCAHLLVKHKGSRKPSSWKTAEITRTKEEAMSIILAYEAKILAGSVTLADLAVEESDCSSARKRGDLGYFGRGDMQKEFEDAAFALKVGEMSHVVETASGLHLIERLG
ncbi:hypothetical protein BGX38DRAFT_1168563 [Terfezia claveryi]|nr:hypothetical protein BGX38DRAFT_1168563 [Terfezia claveryi]